MSWKRGPRIRSTPTVCRQGTHHQSKAEAYRCDELHLLAQAGEITELEAHPQPTYRLDVNGVHIANYSPDFRYIDRDGARVAEDVKGHATEVYKLKKRLLLALHGVDVVEIRPRYRR